MCIAILKPADRVISEEILQACNEHNNDGAGFMYAENDQLHVQKGFFRFDDFMEAYKKHENKKCVLHFRIKTHGDLSEDNCHPFNVSDKLAFVHNGIIKIEETNKKYSDTWHFNEKIVKPLYKDNQGFLKKVYVKELLSGFIGYSKLIFMDNKGRSTIVNADKGEWSNGVWYSNTSYHPRKSYFPQQTQKVLPYQQNEPIVHKWPFLEGDYVQFKYRYEMFKKGDVVFVDTVLANGHLRVILHDWNENGTLYEISRVIPAYVLEEMKGN